MLSGVFKYCGHTYAIEGYDFGDSIDFRLYPSLFEDKVFLDQGHIYSDGNKDLPNWESIWCNVGNGAISVECYTEMYGDEKVKNAINKDVFIAFGQIIRGMKSGCNGTNLVRGDDELFDTGFNPRSTFTHEYGTKGNITLRMQIIEKLYYSYNDIEISIEDDFQFSKQIFADHKSPYKFKLDLSEFVVNTINEEEDWELFGSDKVFSLQEIIERNLTKSYVWLNERKYYIVKDIDMCERVCKYLWQFKLLAFDTETTGLNINITSRRGQGDRCVGVIFSGEPGIAYYFPIAMKKVKNICTPGNEQAIIERYFKPLLEQKDIICHNGAFDWKVMHNYGICLNLKHDTYILFKVTLGNDHPNLKLGLKDLTKQFLNRDSFELKDFVVGKFGTNIKFWDLDEESTKYYACPDCDNLIELFDYAMKAGLLEEYEAKKIYEIETLFSIVIAYQEYYGHHIAIEKRDQLVADIIKTKETSYAKMVEIVGHDFKPNSNKDLPKVMFEELGIPVIDYTETGNPSAGKEVRLKLMEEENADGSPKYPFVHALHEWKSASTLESNFTKQIDALATEDGLMFSSVNQFLKTGRVSTSDPNYQGYSDVVKKYVNSRNGFYCLDADYSTVEARIMCSMSGCKGMVEKLKNPDTDYHRQKASDMFTVPYELVTKELRQMSKGVNFGILYGLGDRNLGENLYGRKSPENTRKAAHQKELYYKGMEELRPFTEESRNQGVEKGYSTTFFKRRRYYNKAKTRTDTIMRQSCNARIQGTAADLYKLGMVRLFTEIKRRGWLGKFLIDAFVHDECYCEVSKSINPFLALKVVRQAMMIEIEGWCPLFTGMGVGSTWYEAKKTEIPVQVQISLINKYAENCPDWWNGDIEVLSKFVVDSIMDYKRDRVLGYLEDENNWHKVIQPTENELMVELLKDIKKGQKVKGALDNITINISDDLLENVKTFCILFDKGELFEQSDIQKPQLTTGFKEEDNEEDILEQEEINPFEALKMRVEAMGVVSSNASGKRVIYFKWEDNNPVLMRLVSNIANKNPGDIELRTIKNGEEFTTGMSINPKAYPKLLQIYMNNRNLKKAGVLK